MPCKCGATRIVRKKVQCPHCDSIKISDPRQRIHEMKQRVRQLCLDVQQALTKVDPDELVEALIIEREKAAQNRLIHATSKKDAMKRWLAISYLLSKYPWVGEGVPTRPFIELLITSSKEILECENDIFRLRNGLAQIVAIDGSEEIASTEFDVLSRVPDDVLKQYQQLFVLPHGIIENRDGQIRNLEIQGIKEAIIQPGLPIMVGNELYRELKSIYRYRILPAISPSNVDNFISTSLRLAGFLAFLLGRDFVDKQGILKTDFSKLMHLKSFLTDKFGVENVESYFQNFRISSLTHPTSLGSTVIIMTRKGTVFLPYFSIFLLVYLCLQWTKNPEKGEFHRYIGKSAEDIIFSFAKAYAFDTDHPLHKNPLVRVPHPEKKNEEIADIMVYDSKYLVVIESKFRETLTTADLDFELAKFSRNLDYIRDNLAKFGFPETLEIKPFFYTPFPAYNEWNGIKLTPSLILMGIEFSNLVGIRPTELASRSQPLQQLLQSIEGPTPYPIDASLIDQSFSPDTYRVQDGVVTDYDEGEVTVLMDNPIGVPTPLIVDINKDIYAELETECVGKGDMIKMALLNLNEAWSQIQMVEFKLIGTYKSPRNELDIYGLLSILSLNSKELALDKLVHQTWGKKLGDEILNILKKWDIDFAKFIQHQMNKGQNVLIGVGKMLGLSDSFDILVQCKCGEIMGFHPHSIEIVRKLYPDGVIKCNKCDPTQIRRLGKLGYPIVPLDHSVLTEYMLERARYPQTNRTEKSCLKQ